MPAPIEFFFDFASPYGYFAAQRIDDIGARHGREVLWRPILLGPAFKATGQAPLVQQPLRGEYAVHDWNRLARRDGVPFVLPAGFPMAALAASRIFYWLDDRDTALAKAFARLIYHAYFGEGRDMSPPDAVAGEAAVLGVDSGQAIAAAKDEAWKGKLRAVTEEALARGVFGSPFVFVDGERFWGNDRLDMVDEWLARGGW